VVGTARAALIACKEPAVINTLTTTFVPIPRGRRIGALFFFCGMRVIRRFYEVPITGGDPQMVVDLKGFY
jgi:hypothetical protein